ncbi:MAG: 30S ribosomal protein S18 [Bdellovibrionales bacterium]
MERNSGRDRDRDRDNRDDRNRDSQDDSGGEKGMRKTYRSKFRPDFPADFEFDYKDPVTLSRFIMEGGKIVPSRISKLSSSQQKNVAAAIRKARSLALLPNGTEAYDSFERPETISPKPFTLE